MARAIVWTEGAVRDLEDAAEYIARDSKFYAAALVREARAAANSLGEFAERGRAVPEAGSPAVRELFVQSHRLIYRMDAERVAVLALVHGARDLPSLARREGRKIVRPGHGSRKAPNR